MILIPCLLQIILQERHEIVKMLRAPLVTLLPDRRNQPIFLNVLNTALIRFSSRSLVCSPFRTCLHFILQLLPLLLGDHQPDACLVDSTEEDEFQCYREKHRKEQFPSGSDLIGKIRQTGSAISPFPPDRPSSPDRGIWGTEVC